MNIKHRFTAAAVAAICISTLTSLSFTTVYAEPDEPYYDPEADPSYEYNNFDNYHENEYYYDDDNNDYNDYDYDNEYYDDNTYTDYYDNNYYDDEYDYDDQETNETADETAELAPEGSVDTTELTSSDWESLQSSQAASDENTQANTNDKSSKSSDPQSIVPSSNSGHSDFDNIKNNENNQDSNDTWIFLFGGVLLILAGIGIVIAVVVVNVKAKHRADAEKKIAEHTASPINFKTYTPKSKSAPKRDFLGARHVAKKESKNKVSNNSLPKDLVDTLDKPLDISNIDKNALK